MSRSRKKTPCASYAFGHRKWWKKKSNKKVRNQEELADGRSYKKVYDLEWNIDDYKEITSWEDMKKKWESGERYITVNTIEELEEWFRKDWLRK